MVINISTDREVWNEDDQTLFLRKNDSGFPELEERLEEVRGRETGATVEASIECPAMDRPVLVGRALACHCYGGEFISVSVRKKAGTTVTAKRPRPPAVAEMDGDEGGKKICGYAASGRVPTEKHPFPEDLVPTMLFSVLDQLRTAAPQGLLVVGGTTGSGKTTIARGLIHVFLRRLAEQGGWPHFVSIEDDVEDVFARDPSVALRWGIYHTQRRREDDGDLRRMLADALRQKPALVYVGEIREDGDWKDILDFAGTGHLIVATAHAGSVRGLMSKLARASKCHVPADRGELANRLLALVHTCKLTTEREGQTDARREVFVPAFWSSKPASRAAFVRSGIGSITPEYAAPDQQHPAMAGRRWCLQKLYDSTAVSFRDGIPADDQAAWRDHRLTEGELGKLMGQATALDMEGK